MRWESWVWGSTEKGNIVVEAVTQHVVCDECRRHQPLLLELDQDSVQSPFEPIHWESVGLWLTGSMSLAVEVHHVARLSGRVTGMHFENNNAIAYQELSSHHRPQVRTS
jgi:hypothetical protein